MYNCGITQHRVPYLSAPATMFPHDGALFQVSFPFTFTFVVYVTMLSEFYAKMVMSPNSCVSTHKRLTSSPHLPKQQQQQQGKSVRSWSSNPLVWTTVVALSVAVVATTIIVPLVVSAHVRRRCAGQ